MGSKKRNSPSVEAEASPAEFVSEKKQKMLLKNQDASAEDDGTHAPSTSAYSALKPMERKKKRKSMDKERRHHRVSVETGLQVKEKLKRQFVMRNCGGSGTNAVPVFHIGVFNELASVDGSVREAAVEVLVRELREVQRAYEEEEAVGGKDGEEDGSVKLDAAVERDDDDDGLEDCAPSVRYAVRRLVRGVSSSRECARQGFALGLTVLVATIPSIRVGSLLKLILQLLEVTSSMKGQEARDCLLGQLFAYGALARSRRLRDEWVSDENTSCIKDFTAHLISLASKKRYLQEPAVAVLETLIEMLPADVVVNHILEAPGVKEWFEEAKDAGNPDALFLALKLRGQNPADSTIFGKLLPYPFSPEKFFTFGHLPSLTNCLKESTFCQPRVHGIWPLLVSILLPDKNQSTTMIKKRKKSRKSGASDEDLTSNIKCFCEVVLDGSLLSSSHDRKHLAFDVVLLMLPRLSASYLHIVLSQKFVQCLMDILSTKDSWLFKVADHFLRKLSDWIDSEVENDIRRVYTILTLQKHSDGKFDFDTRRRTIRDLMTGFKTDSGCDLLIEELTSMFLDEGNVSDDPSDQSQTTDDNSEIGSVDEKDATGASTSSDTLRSWTIESIQSILKNLKLESESMFQVQKKVMKFLAVQGLFSPSLGREVTSFDLQEKFKWPIGTIRRDLSRMCVEQLQLFFLNAYKFNGFENDLGHYFVRFFSVLGSIPTVSLIRHMSDEEQRVLEDLQAMESKLYGQERECKLGSEAQKKLAKLRALRYLLIQLLPQLVFQPGDLSEAVSELLMCSRKLFAAPFHHDSSGEDETVNDVSPDVMDVLVDTLLSLLPQTSAPLRSSVEQVFRFFCEDVTEDGLLRMFRIIKKNLKSPRYKDVGGDDSDSDDDLLGIEEAEEPGEAESLLTRESWDEKTDGSDALSTMEAERPAASDEGSGDEKADDSEAVSNMVAGGEKVDEASYDSDDEVDDDHMFRMDHVFAGILQEKKGHTESQLVLFKLRVLSLLEIYVTKNPGKPAVLSVYSNLVQAFINPHATEGNEQLGQRIRVIQRKIIEANDYPKGKDVELSTLESLLEKYLSLASKPFKKKKSAANISKQQSTSWKRYKLTKSLSQDSTYWILKIIDGKKLPETELFRVIDIFKRIISGYFESKKSELKCEFLKEIFRRRPWVGYLLFGFIVEKCSDSRSEFRRVEALELLFEILKPLQSRSDPSLKGILEKHLPEFCHLISELVLHMPEKQSRCAEVRKFCGKVFRILVKQNMAESFLEALQPEVHTACGSQIGEPFLALKRG